MYRKLGPHDGLKDEGQEVIDFTETLNVENGSSAGNPGRVLLTFMNSKQTANSQIVAFSPIYLMNNNGKTLEII